MGPLVFPMDYLVLGIALLIMVLLVLVVVQQKRAADEQKRATERLFRAVEERRRSLEELTSNSPMIITDALYEKLHGATFAILDDEGHPVCCGFFVSTCGVALSAAHSCEYARPSGSDRRVFRASMYGGQEFSLDLVDPRVGTLDIAVLRASGALPAGMDYLPLPSTRQSHQQLLGAPVALIHGSIAWSGGAGGVKQIARDNGTIITSNETLIHYSVSSYKGHSGAALLFRSGQLSGLHSEGFDDLQQDSEMSPSTSADAVRLDAPLIWGAVQAAMAVSSADSAASGGGGRRRKQSRPPGI